MVQYRLIDPSEIELLHEAKRFHQVNLDTIQRLRISDESNAAVKVLAREIREKILKSIDNCIELIQIIDAVSIEAKAMNAPTREINRLIGAISDSCYIQSSIVAAGRSHE